jgi:L,D-transpeptidase catalytic domain
MWIIALYRGPRALTKGVSRHLSGAFTESIDLMRLIFSLFEMTGVLLLAWVSSSCRLSEPVRMVRQSQKTLYQWHDDGGPGKVTVTISLPDQIAEFQRDGRDIGWCYVATGREGFGTRAGTYKITEKIVDKYSNRYGWIEDEFGNVVNPDAKAGQKVEEGMVYVPAPMPYWMRLTSYGIGMHGGYIPEPGKPASHGCIRMPKEIVATVFDAVEVGTPVTITSERAGRYASPEVEPLPSYDPYAGLPATVMPVRSARVGIDTW